MNLLDLLVFVASGACVLAHVCRLDALEIRRHRFSIVALHVGLAGVVFEAALNAAHGATDLQDVLAVVAAGSWIMVSRVSWSEGVPRHFERMPMQELDDRAIRVVAGGRK